MIPDPCTLLFGVPSEAPAAGDPWNVAHWSHLAGRAGLTVRPSPTTSGHGDPTWCGDVDIDGLVYRVHRGLRKRIPVLYDGSEGFEFEQSVWVEPVVALPVGPELSFRLDLPPGHHATLATGLATVWSP